MKLKHFGLLLMVAGLLVLHTLGCKPKRNIEDDLPAHVRFLNAMIPQGSDTVSYFVLLDGQTVPWGGSWRIGSTSQGQEIDASGRHRIQVTDHLPGVQGARVLLSADLQFEQLRGYTCVLTGTIPDSGADSNATALVVPDDLYRNQNHVGIRLVNAALSGSTTGLSSHDSVLVRDLGPLHSSNYITLPPGNYTFGIWGSSHFADPLQLSVDSGATASYTAYYIGTHKYTQLPRAPHGVLLED